MKEVIKLKKTIEINGEEVKELSYDSDEITPEMFSKASTMASNDGRANGTPKMDVMELDYGLHMYLGMMAIIAVNPSIDVDDLKRLKGADVIKITQVGRNFINSNVEETSEESSSEEQSEATPESTTQESKK